MRVIPRTSDPTIVFAATELVRYLRLMSPTPLAAQVASAGDGIVLGVFGDAGLGGAVAGRAPDPDNDAVAISVGAGVGVIAGANPRSVLLGVYRFLHQLGCRWVRPGAEGERIPVCDPRTARVDIYEQAAHRHRAICIEGAVSVEHVLALVDWLPKAGFSGYFMQFFDGNAFFARWYERRNLGHGEPEPFSAAAARAHAIRVEEAIRLRSLVYHDVGHGWTCAALGWDVQHWDPALMPMDAGRQELLAEVGGRRALRWDRPMITSLCFGQPEARHRMVQAVVAYARDHAEVDLLHVWLDDGGNNKCTCPACAGSRPADVYITLLRELDAALTAIGSRQRIVFLGYSDLLWPPAEGAPGLDPRRFTFMYANSRSNYQQRIGAPRPQAQMPAYERNRSRLTGDMDEFHAFLAGWQRYFPGDGFIYEYYFSIFRTCFDPLALARLIHADVADLRANRLNGLVSCQTQRAFFPSGLAMSVMGSCLWGGGDQDLETLVDDHFMAAYGAEAGKCKEFLKVAGEALSAAIDIDGPLTPRPECVRHLARLDRLIDGIAPVAERGVASADPCHARSWHLLRWHLRLLRQLLPVFQAIADAAPTQKTLEAWKACKAFLVANERHFQDTCDLSSLIGHFDDRILNRSYSARPEDVVR